VSAATIERVQTRGAAGLHTTAVYVTYHSALVR